MCFEGYDSSLKQSETYFETVSNDRQIEVSKLSYGKSGLKYGGTLEGIGRARLGNEATPKVDRENSFSWLKMGTEKKEKRVKTKA